MIKILLTNNLSVINYYINNISDEKIFQFLQGRTNAETNLISKDLLDQVENIFYKLDRPLINLGLACYGENIDIVRSLYKNSCFEVRLATLGNKKAFQDHARPYDSLFNKSQIEEILLLGNSPEQQAILQNQYISSDLLFQLFNKSEIFTSSTESHWQKLISYTVANQKLQKLPLSYPYTINHKSWKKAVTSAWLLSKNVNVNNEWAHLLCGLYENLYKLEFQDKEINNIIKRWQQPLSENQNEGTYFSIRMHLADHIPISSNTERQFTESDDQAIRSSFYKRFVPCSIEELNNYFSIDREQFFIFAVNNENIKNNKKLLNKLYEYCDELDRDGLFYTYILEKILLGSIKHK